MTSKNSLPATQNKEGSAGLPAISDFTSAVPAFMQGVKESGPDFDVEDLIIPRVTLLQGISPVVMAGEAENGHFYHTIMNIDMGPQIHVVPILYRKQVTLWNPIHAGGGVLARASDGKVWDADFDVSVAPYKDMPKKLVKYTAKKGDPVGTRNVPGSGLAAWGSMDPDNEDAGPAATISYVFMCRAIEFWDLGPFIVFLQRSADKTAREWMTQIKTLRDGRLKVPMFGQVYAMSCKGDQNNAGQEYNAYDFKHKGFVTDADIFASLQAENESYSEARFRTNDESDDLGGGDNGGASGGESSKDNADDKY